MSRPPRKLLPASSTVVLISGFVIVKDWLKVLPVMDMFEFEKTVFAPYIVHTVPVTPMQLEMDTSDCEKVPPLKLSHVVYTGALVSWLKLSVE